MHKLLSKTLLLLTVYLFAGGIALAETPGANASLTGVYWKLVEMDDHRVLFGPGQRETHIVLENEGILFGFAGCNWMRGRYELDGERIQFPPPMLTRKACFPGMETEKAFLARLPEVRHFSIVGESLALYNSEGRLVLRLEAEKLY